MIRYNCGSEWCATDDALLVSVWGEIDHHGAVRLRRDVDAQILAQGKRRLVLDMSGVTFMDSSGLGFIMGRYKLIGESGGSLTVQDPSPFVERVLRSTGFDKKIKIVKTAASRRGGA